MTIQEIIKEASIGDETATAIIAEGISDEKLAGKVVKYVQKALHDVNLSMIDIMLLNGTYGLENTIREYEQINGEL